MSSAGSDGNEEEEFFDALDEHRAGHEARAVPQSARAPILSPPPAPAPVPVPVRSPPPPPTPPRPPPAIEEHMAELSLTGDTDEQRSGAGSPSASELSVHSFGVADETAPRLSQYHSRLGGAHPLSGLTPSRRPGERAESESEVGETVSAESLSSFGGLSVALSEGEAVRPRRIRVKCRKKSRSEFGRMLLIQELSTATTRPHTPDGAAPESPRSHTTAAGGSGALYSAKFSADGNYLAVAGEDGLVRVWKLLVEDTMALVQEHPEYAPPRMAAIFQQEPIQVLAGHTGAVLDLSWSRNNFLLSASMDRTVRLWHFSRAECLGVFRHPDFVTSVAFHPRDDRVFVTGSLDCRLRLWSIADKTVRAWNELPANNFVTAVAFTHSGKLVLAGTTTGVCLVFETDGFSYSTQIHVHSRRGKNRIGKKICGIESMPGDSGDEKILISTNDSRIRLYTLRDKSVVSKFIGHKDDSSQIKGTFSDDGEFVISGSEDGKIFIWNVENRYQQRSLFSRTPPHHVKAREYFHAHSRDVTCAIFAPSAVRNRLQGVGLRPVLGGESEEGQIIVAVDLNGRIKVYENSSLLEPWLLKAQ